MIKKAFLLIFCEKYFYKENMTISQKVEYLNSFFFTNCLSAAKHGFLTTKVFCVSTAQSGMSNRKLKDLFHFFWSPLKC